MSDKTYNRIEAPVAPGWVNQAHQPHIHDLGDQLGGSRGYYKESEKSPKF